MSEPMRYALWRLAQHKYGWGYLRRVTGMALQRRGLVEGVRQDGAWALTDAGKREVVRRWPRAPFIVASYEIPIGGWSRLDDDLVLRETGESAPFIELGADG